MVTKITLNMLFEDLEVLRERKAEFNEYYHLQLDAAKELNNKDFALFTYALLNDVRNLGGKENEYSLKQRMIQKINEL